jgi:hypothetical protein
LKVQYSIQNRKDGGATRQAHPKHSAMSGAYICDLIWKSSRLMPNRSAARAKIMECLKMTFSIVIPNYNYGRFGGKAIESALAVEWPDLEAIAFDGGFVCHARCDASRAVDRPNLPESYRRGLGAADPGGVQTMGHEVDRAAICATQCSSNV